MKTPNERESAVLKFWQENHIFEKSLAKNPTEKEGGKSFRYYDGPPYATGLPHFGHIVQSAVKDTLPRYKTMQGFNVPRTWGWDCHGLPIENLVEKELGFKGKKDIEEYGVDRFNEAARASVFAFREDWKKIIPRLGRWVDMDHDYRTLDATFMESGLWAFKQLWDKDLVYEGYKVMPWCPHCGTVLSNHEVSEGYAEITDLSAYVKFPINTLDKTSLIAWTTTPWTLPGNVALAVNPDIVYIYASLTNEAGEIETIIFSKSSLEKVTSFVKNGTTLQIQKEVLGKELLGLSYTAPFSYFPVEDKMHIVYGADFVTDTDGTGVVHIAPAFGEDDMKLAKEYGLPVIKHILPSGEFSPEVTDLHGQAKPKDDHQKSDIEVIKLLAHKAFGTESLLFAKEKYIHTYPHCWRCKTPLLNYATSSWFIKTTALKQRMLEENAKINWYPDEIGTKRLNAWLENVRDWAVSRSRFWGTPLPVWKGEKTGQTICLGGVQSIKEKTKRNTYMLLRHGEATHLTENVMSSHLEFAEKHGLTDVGRKEIEASVEKMVARKNIPTVIYYSPLRRTRETAELVHDLLKSKLSLDLDIRADLRLKEEDFGDLDGHDRSEHDAYRTTDEEMITKKFPNGEAYLDLKKRVADFMYDVDAKEKDQTILIITHEGCIYGIQEASAGLNTQQIIETHKNIHTVKPGEYVFADFAFIPHNQEFELDFHRPYIDSVIFEFEGDTYTRLPEVLDVWYDAGSMPFASIHYPFEHEQQFDETFPVDFVAEALDQTRGWFYHMLIMSVALFDKLPFKNVMVSGLVLASDGKKMSKSLKNYPDVLPVAEQYGADTLRYFLLSSAVVRGEELIFSEKALTEINNKVFNKIENVMSFLEMYGSKNLNNTASIEPHVLDNWIQVKLNDLISAATHSFDAYQVDRAVRPIMDFVEELSTWYLRRSRDRFKDEIDSVVVTRALLDVLVTLAKVMAPVTPFMAEEIYQFVKTFDVANADAYVESVHLENWPKVIDSISDEEASAFILKMEKTREVIETGLALRNKAGIKVRQPLASLLVGAEALSSIHVDIVKDELNVKEVISSEDGSTSIDEKLTFELMVEGLSREIIRDIQSKRKELNLSPKDKIEVVIKVPDLYPHKDMLSYMLDENHPRYAKDFKNNIQAIVNAISITIQITDNEKLEILVTKI